MYVRKRQKRKREEEYIRQELESRAVPFETTASQATPQMVQSSKAEFVREVQPLTYGPASVASIQSSYDPSTAFGARDDDVAAVPALLARLNHIMERLPRAAGETGEEPPRYDS